jgi:hypothetical protein
MKLGNQYVYKCPTCGNLLYNNSLMSGNLYGAKFYSDGKMKDAEPVEFLDVDDLFRVLDSNLIENKQDEKSVRIRIWRTFNDRMRDNPSYHFDEADEQRWISNIKKLIPLLNSSNDGQAIMLAELHRNLSEFERCAEILDTVTDEDYSDDIKEIRLNCLFENRWVVQIVYS